MKQKHWILVMIFLSGILTACGQDGRYQLTVITDEVHTLSGKISGDLIIVGGEVTLEQGAVLDGSAYLIAGKFNVAGEIRGDVSFWGGEFSLGSHARISGDFNIGGGQLSGLDQAVVAGKVNTGSGMKIPSQPTRQSQNPGGTMLRWLISAVVLGLIAATLQRYLPRQVIQVSEAALRHLPVSLAMGILAGIVGLSLLVLLAYTIILIPVALLGLAFLGVAVIYGWLTCGIALGRWAARRLNSPIRPGAAAFGGTLFFILLLNILSAIPWAGGIFGILVAATGLGAVFLTRFGLRRFIPETSEADLST